METFTPSLDWGNELVASALWVAKASTPALMARRLPATAARAPAIAQEMAKTLPTLTPCVSAASWSKATARMAMPSRVRKK